MRRAFRIALKIHYDSAAKVIQCWWRGRQQRRRFLFQRQAVCIVQRRWRDILAQKALLRLVIQLQAAARAFLVKQDILVCLYFNLTFLVEHFPVFISFILLFSSKPPRHW